MPKPIRLLAILKEVFKIISSFTGQNHFLSNFYPCTIKAGNLTFGSVEAAFQAAKCANPADRKLFVGLTPGEAKRLGRRIALRPDWDSTRISAMRFLVNLKFKDPELRAMLVATRPHELVEGNTWGDRFWGVCDGAGQNWLGRVLMEVRDQI